MGDVTPSVPSTSTQSTVPTPDTQPDVKDSSTRKYVPKRTSASSFQEDLSIIEKAKLEIAEMKLEMARKRQAKEDVLIDLQIKKVQLEVYELEQRLEVSVVTGDLVVE